MIRPSCCYYSKLFIMLRYPFSDEGEDNCVYCECCGLQFVDKRSEYNDLAEIWNGLPRHKA